MKKGKKKKKISIGYLGNLKYDTRTFNLFQSLKARDHRVIFNGFDWMTPDFKTVKSPEINIFRLVKTRFSLLYYIQFGVLLMVQLLKQEADIYFASDVYALPICVLVAKIKHANVFYDSREIFTEMPAFQGRQWLKLAFIIIERLSIHQVDIILTTGDLDSQYIQEKYGLSRKPLVLRNLPLIRNRIHPVDYSQQLTVPKQSKILLYQGIIVTGRGIESCFRVLLKYPKGVLVVLGWGEYQRFYEEMANRMGVRDRVFFIGKIPQEELLNYSAGADVGMCLIDNISFNNYYALPNKLFEYVMAGIPVIVSDLPQMKSMVEKYQIGAVVPEGDEDGVADVLKQWEENPHLYHRLKKCCQLAARELNWETEFQKMVPWFE